MSLTLNYRDIRKADFPKALRKLAECSEIKNVTVLLKIVKVYKAVVEAEKEFLEVQKKLMEQHGTMEDGKLKIVNQEGLEKDIEELLKTEFQIDTDVLRFNDLTPAKLSAVDIAALDNLISL